MTERDIITEISTVTGYSTADVALILGGMWGVLKRELVRGNGLTIRGFGRFATRVRAAKPVQNFKEGRRYVLPPRWEPTFTPCDNLRVRVAARPVLSMRPMRSIRTKQKAVLLPQGRPKTIRRPGGAKTAVAVDRR